MSRFLPDCFNEHVVTLLPTEKDHRGRDVAMQEPKVSNRRLDLPAWMAAWDSYALGAAMLGQMSYSQAMLHKEHIVRVCSDAHVREAGLCVHVCCLSDRLREHGQTVVASVVR